MRSQARAKRSPWDRVKYQILLHWPLRFWWHLSPETRDWWLREYQARNGGKNTWP